MGLRRDNIEVHIDRVVLDGFEGVDVTVVFESCQRRLASLLHQGFVPASGSGFERRLGDASISLPPDPGAAAIGVQIAESLAKGIGR